MIHHFIMKIPNKINLQQIASNHLSDTEFEDFMKIYKDNIKEPFSLFVNDATLPSNNSLTFKKNLL